MTENILVAISEEIYENSKQVEYQELVDVVKLVKKSKRVFISGAGRSGFVARAFANRLMHLGIDAYFVGETTTPSIREDDLLVIGSGSGETSGLVLNAKKAKSVKARIATITIFPENSIGKLSDAYIKLPGLSSKTENKGDAKSIQVHGSQFEQLSLLVYDALVAILKSELKVEQEEMDYRHANLE